MTRKITISLEKDWARVVYAKRRGRGYVIEDILTVDYHEIDHFLASEKNRDFYVCASFSDYLQQTFYLPPTGKSKLKKLIELELSRVVNFPEGFVYTYFDLGKTIIDGQVKKEIFAVSVPLRQVNEYLSIFKRNNKVVKCLFPDFLSLLNIVPMTDYPVLYIYPKSNEQIMFLVERGRLKFYRSFSAITETIDDIDIQNINMTVNYCKQKLGAEARVAIFIGAPEFSQNLSVEPLVPIANMTMPEDIDLRGIPSAIRLSDIILPISLLKNYRTSDILPSEYKRKRYLSIYLKAASVVFALLSILFLTLTGSNAVRIKHSLSEIGELRTQLTDLHSIYNELNRVKAEYNNYRIPLQYLINHRKSSSPLTILLALPGAVKRKIKIKSIKITRSEQSSGEITFYIEGTVKTDSLAELQSSVEDLLSTIKTIDDIKIVKTNYTLGKKEFYIKGRY